MHRYLNRQGYIIKKDEIDKKTLNDVIKDLTVKPIVFKAYQDFVKPKEFEIYQESKNYLFLPRYYGIERFGPPVKTLLPDGAPLSPDLKFSFKVMPHQKIGYEKATQTLKTTGGGLLSVYCGYGKTILGIKLAIDFGRKTLIVVNKEDLMEQWIERINQSTGGTARIGIVQQDKVDVKDKDFIIAMIHSLSQKDYPKEVFADIGFCIFDEAHHLGAEIFFQCLPKVASKYMLGLSATPNRKDGLSKVFYSYIGPMFHTEKRTGSNRVLVKRFKLSSSESYYETLMMPNGKTKNTTAMITNLANYKIRTQLIIECIRVLMKEDRKILLLSGRRDHLESLFDSLEKEQIKNMHNKPITFGYYYGNKGINKEVHKKMLRESAKCDVILGTYNIASEGLDIPDLNTELHATPTAEVEQAVGRILRKFHTKVNPMVVDLVDKCGNFPKQATARSKFYKDEDYEIQDLKMPLGNDVRDLDPFLKEVTTYLKDTDFKQSRFATNDEEDDLIDPDKPQVKLGKCILDEKPIKSVKISLKQDKKKDISTQTTESMLTQNNKITLPIKKDDLPANPIQNVLPSSDQTKKQTIIEMFKQKHGKSPKKLRVTGVRGGKAINMNLKQCLLDE